MMRKLLSTAIVLMLTLALCLSAAACAKKPSVDPSPSPSVSVSTSPSAPTAEPSKTTEPSTPTVKPSPSQDPTLTPTTEPTETPTTKPSEGPTTTPTTEPTVNPTKPSVNPTQPSINPTVNPTTEPSVKPTPDDNNPDFDNMTEDEFKEWCQRHFTDKTVKYTGEHQTIEPDFPEELQDAWEYADADAEYIDADVYVIDLVVEYGDFFAEISATLTIERAEVEWIGDETQTFEADGTVKYLEVSTTSGGAISGNDGMSSVGTKEFHLTVASTKNYNSSEKTFTMIITGLTDEQASPVFMIGDEVYDAETHGGSEDNPIDGLVGFNCSLPEGFKVMTNVAVEGYPQFTPSDMTTSAMIRVYSYASGDYITGADPITVEEFMQNADEYKYSIGGRVRLDITATNDIYGGKTAALSIYVQVKNGDNVPKDNAITDGSFATGSLNDLFGWNAQNWVRAGIVTTDYENSHHFDGSGALRIDASCSNGNMTRLMYFKGGFYYRVTFWYRASADYRTGGSPDTHVWLVDPSGWTAKDGNGVPTSLNADNSTGKTEIKNLAQAPTEWTKAESQLIHVTEDGYYGFTIKTNGMMKGYIWFDEIEAYVVGEEPEEGSYWKWEDYSKIAAKDFSVVSNGEYTYTTTTPEEGVTFTYLVADEDQEFEGTPTAEVKINPNGGVYHGKIKIIAHKDGTLMDYTRVINVTVIDASLPEIAIKYYDEDGETELTEIADLRRPGETFTIADEVLKEDYVFMGWNRIDEAGDPVESVTWKSSYTLEDGLVAGDEVRLVATYTPVIKTNRMYNAEVAGKDDSTGGNMGFNHSYDPSVSYLADGTGSVHFKTEGGSMSGQMRYRFAAQRGVTYVLGFAGKASDDFEVGNAFDSGNCISYEYPNGSREDLDGSGFVWNTKNLAGTRGAWTWVQFEWTAPRDGDFSLFFKMHGVVKGEVWYDHFVAVEKGAYADYKTTWTTEMAKTITVPSGSFVGDAEIGGYDYVASTTLENVEISYVVDNSEVEVAEAGVLNYGVHTVTVIFRTAGYEAYKVTVQVAVVDPNAEKHTVSYFDGETELTDLKQTDITENEEVSLPAGPEKRNYIFRGWHIGDDETLREAGYAFPVTADTIVYAVYDELLTSNRFLFDGSIPLGTGTVNDGGGDYSDAHIKGYEGSIWGWNANKYEISSTSYYVDGTGAYAVPDGGATAHFWMYLQAGVTYNVSFYYSFTNLTNKGDDTHLKLCTEPNTCGNGALGEDYRDELFAEMGTTQWKLFSKQITVSQDGYYDMWYQSRATFGQLLFDEISCYPEGYGPEEDKSTLYWTAPEAAKVSAEDQTVQLEDGKATYTGATAPDGVTIQYIVGETTYDTFEVTTDTETDIIVRFTNKKGLTLDKTVHFIARASLESKTLTFAAGADDATGEIEAITEYINARITLPENPFTREGYVFEGWTINDTLYLAGAEFTLTDDFTATATWTQIIYGNLLEDGHISKDFNLNNGNYIEEGVVRTNDLTTSFYADGTGSLKYASVKDESINAQLQLGSSQNLAKGVQYTLTFVVKTQNFTKTSTYGAATYIKKWNGKGFDNFQNVTTQFSSANFAENQDWTRYTITFTPDATGIYGFQIEMHGVKNGSIIWYDEISMYAEGSPAEEYNYFLASEVTEFVADNANIEYDGEAHAYTATAPEGVSISYVMNETTYTELTVTDAGIYNVTVIFSKDGKEYRKNVTITVVNNAVKYTVKFVDGETEVNTMADVVENSDITLPEALTKDGYIFAGWKLEGTVYAAGATYKVTGDCTFAAEWKELLTSNRFVFDGALPSSVEVKDIGWALKTSDYPTNVIGGYLANNAKLVDKSYYYDGTMAFSAYASAGSSRFWMILQGGVTYKISFMYSYTGFTGDLGGGDNFIKITSASEIDPAQSSDDYDGEIFSVVGDKGWTKFEVEFTPNVDGGYELIYSNRAKFTEFLMDEFACYPVGYEPASKADQYFTSDEIASFVAEDANFTLTEEATTASYVATAPEGITIQYSTDGGETFEDSFETDTAATYNLIVRFSQGEKHFDKAVVVKVFSNVVPATIKYSANEVTISTDEDHVVGDKIELIDLDAQYLPEGYRFDGWSDGENTYAVGAEYEIKDAEVTLTAVLTKLIYGEILADTIYDPATWNATGWGDHNWTQNGNSAQFDWADASGAHLHASINVNLQKGVTYVLSAKVEGNVKVDNVGGCYLAYAITKEGTGGSGFLSRVSDELMICPQGGERSYNGETLKISYTCDADGEYKLGLWAWSVSNSTFTVSELSLKAVNPNAIDGGELITNGALSSENGWENIMWNMNYELGENGVVFKGDTGATRHGYLVQNINLVAGVNYTLTYWIAANEVTTSSGATDVRIATEKISEQSDVIRLAFPINTYTDPVTFSWKKMTGTFSVEKTGTYPLSVFCYGLESGLIYVKNVSVRYNGDLLDATFDGDTSAVRSKWEEENRASFTCDKTMSATEDGTGSLKIQGLATLDKLGRTDGLTTFVNFGFNVKEGKTYKVSFDFCADNMANSGADCYTKVFNSSLDGDAATSAVAFGAIYWDCLSGKNWDHREGTFTATEDGEYVLHFKLYGLAGTIWLDNIKVTEVNDNVENIPAEAPAAPEAFEMVVFTGSYADAEGTYTLTLDGAGKGTFGGNAITYTVISENSISISGIGESAITATYADGALTMTVNDESVVLSKQN